MAIIIILNIFLINKVHSISISSQISEIEKKMVTIEETVGKDEKTVQLTSEIEQENWFNVNISKLKNKKKVSEGKVVNMTRNGGKHFQVNGGKHFQVNEEPHLLKRSFLSNESKNKEVWIQVPTAEGWLQKKILKSHRDWQIGTVILDEVKELSRQVESSKVETVFETVLSKRNPLSVLVDIIGLFFSEGTVENIQKFNQLKEVIMEGFKDELESKWKDQIDEVIERKEDFLNFKNDNNLPKNHLYTGLQNFYRWFYFSHLGYFMDQRVEGSPSRIVKAPSQRFEAEKEELITLNLQALIFFIKGGQLSVSGPLFETLNDQGQFEQGQILMSQFNRPHFTSGCNEGQMRSQYQNLFLHKAQQISDVEMTISEGVVSTSLCKPIFIKDKEGKKVYLLEKGVKEKKKLNPGVQKMLKKEGRNVYKSRLGEGVLEKVSNKQTLLAKIYNYVKKPLTVGATVKLSNEELEDLQESLIEKELEGYDSMFEIKEGRDSVFIGFGGSSMLAPFFYVENHKAQKRKEEYQEEEPYRTFENCWVCMALKPDCFSKNIKDRFTTYYGASSEGREDKMAYFNIIDFGHQVKKVNHLSENCKNRSKSYA